MRKHTKYPGFIEDLGSPWVGRFYIGEDEYWAEFTEPLPPDACVGRLFTIHETKAGKVYFFWLPGRKRRSRRQIKKYWRRAVEMRRELTAGDPLFDRNLFDRDEKHAMRGYVEYLSR